VELSEAGVRHTRFPQGDMGFHQPPKRHFVFRIELQLERAEFSESCEVRLVLRFLKGAT